MKKLKNILFFVALILSIGMFAVGIALLWPQNNGPWIDTQAIKLLGILLTIFSGIYLGIFLWFFCKHHWHELP